MLMATGHGAFSACVCLWLLRETTESYTEPQYLCSSQERTFSWEIYLRATGLRGKICTPPERSPAFAGRGHGGDWECRRGWDTNHQSQREKNTPHTYSQKRENTVGPNPPAVGLSFCISQVCVCGWGWLITFGRLILNPYVRRRAPGQ